jgi:phospho-N-acetylmuramoyl-pentapeptide-transferase
MLLSLADWLQGLGPEFGFLRVVQYLTFRAVMAAMTALLIGIIAGAVGDPPADGAEDRPAGARLRHADAPGQERHAHHGRRAGPDLDRHLHLLWFDWTNRFVWIVLVVTLGFGAIGWADDWRKVVNKDPEGMRSREKYFWQSVIGLSPRCTWCSASPRATTSACWSCSSSGCAPASTSTCRPRPACWCPSSRRSATRWACSAS